MQALIAGFALGIGFIVPFFWWLGLVGIIISLHIIVTARTLWQAAWLLGTIWTLKALCAVVWFWSTYPIERAGVALPVFQLVIIFFYWGTAALWLGSGGVLLGYLARVSYGARALPRVVWFALFPFLWLMAELAGAWFFSLTSLGPGSFLQSYFSFGFVGYLLATTQLGLLWAAPSGIYGVSVVMVSIATALYVLSRVDQSTRVWVGIILGSGFAIGSSAVLMFYPFTNDIYGITAVSIDTTFDAALLAQDTGQAAKLTALTQAVEAAVTAAPDFILLPEDSRYLATMYPGKTSAQMLAHFQFTHRGTASTLIDSARTTLESGETVLRATLLDGISKTAYQFDKQYLVPQGEYTPYLYASIMRLVGYGAAVESIDRDSSYRPGPLVSAGDTPAHLPGILFCFESVRPDGIQALSQVRPAPFIAHPISHGWFHSPQILWSQLEVMLLVQARWSGVPIVSAGNMVAGKIYLPNGQVGSGETIEHGEYWQLNRFTF